LRQHNVVVDFPTENHRVTVPELFKVEMDIERRRKVSEAFETASLTEEWRI